jgi:hypothetical protein
MHPRRGPRPELPSILEPAQLVPCTHGHPPGPLPGGVLASSPIRLATAHRSGDDSPVYWHYTVAAHQGRVSLVINGHKHAYERFTSMTHDGAIDRSFTAPRSFTVGTGRATLLPFSQPARTGTHYRDASHHNVLRITLGNGYWVSEFDRIDGVVADKASAGC